MTPVASTTGCNSLADLHRNAQRKWGLMASGAALLVTSLAGIPPASAADWYPADNGTVADGVAEWGTSSASCNSPEVTVQTTNSQTPLDDSPTRVPVKITAGPGATYFSAKGTIAIRRPATTTPIGQLSVDDLPPYVPGRAGTVQVLNVPNGLGQYEIVGSLLVGFDSKTGEESETTCALNLPVTIRKDIPATVNLSVGRIGFNSLFTGTVLAQTVRSGPVGAPAEVVIEKFWDQTLPTAWLPIGTTQADPTGAFRFEGPEYFDGGTFRARSNATARLQQSPYTANVVLAFDQRPSPPTVDPQPGNASINVRISTVLQHPFKPQTTEYIATATPGGQTCTVSVPLYTTPQAWETCTITGLTNGATYQVSGVASNSAGTSKPYQSTHSTTPYTNPSAPTGLRVDLQPPTAAGGLALATFTWDAADTGGLPLARYMLTVTPLGGTNAELNLSRAMPLPAGQTFTATVRAYGSMGTESPDSAPLSFTTPTYTPLAVIPPAAPPAPTSTATVKAVSGGNKLKVNVNPDKGRGYWTFQVQRRTGTTWTTLAKRYRTTGSKETKTLNLKKGTYRVVVAPKYGLEAGISNEATLRR